MGAGGYTNVLGTTPTMVDTSILEVWAKQDLRRVQYGSYWGKFVGAEGSGMPIIQKTELKGSPGDLIHIQITDPLTGGGVVGDTTRLVENEETLSSSEMKATTELYRHGVRVNIRAGKKSILDLASLCRFRLGEWIDTKVDTIRFTTFLGTTSAVLPAALVGETYTPNMTSFDSALPSGLDPVTPSVDDVDADDFISVKGLQALKLKLRLQKAKPVMVDGKPHFVFVTHPNSTFQLKQESRYEAWVREAQIRGESNPLFTGALAVIDGMVIHDHENVPTVVNAGGKKTSKGIAFGAEAFIEAVDEDISYAQETFDYGNQYGLAVRIAFSPRRALELNSIIAYALAEDV